MLLLVISVLTIAIAASWWFATRAPAVSLALVGAVAAAVGAFVVRGGNALHDGFVVGRRVGPAGVPAAVAVCASIALIALALVGAFVVRPVMPRPWLQDAALAVAGLTPVVAAILAVGLVSACPLYVTGRDAGACSYGQVDVLGGWVSGVVVLAVLDGFALAASLGISSRRVRSRWDATPS
jgi:hypothetical protein